MSDEEKWAELVEDWRQKFDALVCFPLFEGGLMQTDRFGEFERVRDEADAARAEMDKFIEDRFGTSK